MEGQQIGSYTLVRKLGEGGMGAVYLGQHTILGRRAAIKVLLPALSSRPDVVNRFFNEARAVTSICDPGIVQVFDFGYHVDGSAFIVMEFLEGEALDARLHRLGRFPVGEALRLARQVASSLAAAHAQQIVHRDLKPENVFLVRDAEVASGERTKILDFGIAKLSDDHPGKIKTHTGALMGTPIYMSPEQCRGIAELDHRSDIYALGCVLYHLLVGKPPFDGDGVGDIIAKHIVQPPPVPSASLPGLSPALDAFVLRCLAKAPGERFQTMTEVAVAIGGLLATITAPPEAQVAGASTLPPAPHTTKTPTTLGTSAGQVATASVTAPPTPPPRRGLLFGSLALAAAATVVAIVLATTRGGATTPEAPAALPPAPTPVVVMPPLDAAPPPPPPPPPIDAAPPPIDAAPPPADAAPAKQPHHHPATPAHPTSHPTAPVDNCDHAVDSDCDGIPDTR